MASLTSQSNTPLRGTQSFVDVMAQVWHRPSLTAIELLWRTLAFVPSAVLLGYLQIHINPDPSPPSAEQALAMLTALDTKIAALLTLRSLLIGSALGLFWVLVATLGRALVLKRIAPLLHMRYAALCVVGVLRFIAAAATMALWVASCAFAFDHFIWAPLVTGGDANIVGGFALVVTSALALFIAWCCTAWLFQATPLYIMEHRGLGIFSAMKAAWRNRLLRSKLIEINMVMGIVKACLVVLGMVFSASPLPFSSVETQAFLNEWWTGVFLLWVLASDYFHVVRSAAYLRLYEALRQ